MSSLCLWVLLITFVYEEQETNMIILDQKKNPQSPEGGTPLDVFLLLRQAKVSKFLMKMNKVSQGLECISEWTLDALYQ